MSLHRMNFPPVEQLCLYCFNGLLVIAVPQLHIENAESHLSIKIGICVENIVWINFKYLS